MERQTIVITGIGSIHRRNDNRIHLYLMLNPNEDITHEIILSEEASKQFLQESALLLWKEQLSQK